MGVTISKSEINASLLSASKDGDLNLAQWALGHHADPAASSKGWSALHWAAAHGHLDIVKALYEYKCDLNMRGNQRAGLRPIHVAARYGHSNVVEWLVANGADIHAVDLLGKNALHWCALHDRSHTAEMLVTKGADLHSTNETDQTAEEMARWRGNKKTLHTIRSAIERMHGHSTQGRGGEGGEGSPRSFMVPSERLEGSAEVIIAGSDSGAEGQKDLTILTVNNSNTDSLSKNGLVQRGGEVIDAKGESLMLPVIAMSSLELGNVLGEGNYGIVKAGRQKGGSEVAVKIPKAITSRLSLMTSGNYTNYCPTNQYYNQVTPRAEEVTPEYAENKKQEEFRKELEINDHIMKSSYRDHWVNVLGVSLQERVLVMTLMTNKDVEDCLFKRKMFRDQGALKTLLSIAKDAAAAVGNLHEIGIVHRDIAMRNFLLDRGFKAYAGDYGLSVILPNTETKGISKPGKVDLVTCAPEYLENLEFSKKSDVYAFGIFLYEMFSLNYAYNGNLDGMEVDEFADAVVKGKRPSIPESWPLLLASVVKDCLIKDPNDRPTMDLVNRKLRDIMMYMDEGKFEFKWPPPDAAPTDTYNAGQRKSQIIFEEKPLHELNTDEVGRWLCSLSLNEHVERFKQEAIDGALLLDLTDSDLIELEVGSKFHRRSILSRTQTPTAPAAATSSV